MKATDRDLTIDELEFFIARAYETLQRDLEQSGTIPTGAKNLPQKLRPLFEILGAVQLGLINASFTIFTVFIVVNILFHLHP